MKNFWLFNGRGALIVGNLSFASFEEARVWARGTNKEGPHATLGYVEIVADASRPELGRVTTVDAPIQGRLL